MVQPPLSIFSSCIQDGKLSIKLMKVRVSPLAPPCQVQVLSYSFFMHRLFVHLSIY